MTPIGDNVTLAHDEGIQTLFRYMQYPPLSDWSATSEEHRRRLENFVTLGDLYLPLASQFNDPFETSPHFRIPRKADGSIDSDVYIFHLRTRYGPQWGWSPERIAQAEIELTGKVASGTFEPETAVNEAMWRDRLRSEFPMCCLTGDRRNVPMWSYYAGSHTGVCIHFDATVAPFGAAFKVVYTDEYPFLPQPVADLSPRMVIQQCLLVKSKAWAHENEYRMIDMPNYDGGARTLDPPISLQRAGQLIRFRDRHLAGITCGVHMKGDAVERLARICGDRRPRVPIWQAKVAKYKFELSFEEVRG